MKSLARVLAASLAPYGYALFALAFVACLGAGWLVVSRVLDARDARHDAARRSLHRAIAAGDSVLAERDAQLRHVAGRADSLRDAAQRADARALAAESRYRAARGRVRVVGAVVVAAPDSAGAAGAAPDTLATDPRVAGALSACDAAVAAGEAARLQALVALDTTRLALGRALDVIALRDTALARRDSLLALPERKRPRFGFKAGAVTGVVLTLGALKALASLTGAGLRRAIPGP